VTIPAAPAFHFQAGQQGVQLGRIDLRVPIARPGKTAALEAFRTDPKTGAIEGQNLDPCSWLIAEYE